MSRTSNIRLQFYQTFIFFLFRSAFKMEYIQSTRLEVVNGVQTENFQSKSSNEEGQSPDSIEKPIDYSLSRKRRILDNFNEESPLNKTKKTLNYGSDGHSEDSSCSVSPSQNNLLSSPEMDSPEHAIHCNHNLPEIPIFPNIRQPEQEEPRQPTPPGWLEFICVHFTSHHCKHKSFSLTTFRLLFILKWIFKVTS